MMKLPPYPVFPELSNDRVIMRQANLSDMNGLLEISFYDARPAENIDQAIGMQKNIDRDYANGNSIHWCIEDRVTSAIAGTCGYYRGFENNTGELGCVLRESFKGKGYMSAAMKLAIDFGFQHMGLETIAAISMAHNHQAIRLFERLGFTRTARLPGDEVRFELKAT